MVTLWVVLVAWVKALKELYLLRKQNITLLHMLHILQWELAFPLNLLFSLSNLNCISQFNYLKISYNIPSLTMTLSPDIGLSTIIASVVSTKPEIEAAFCKADRVTLAGSIIPDSIIFT